MRAAICDDRAEDAQLVAQYVREWGESREESVALEMFPSAEAFLFAYDEDKNFDLLLLDVEMGGMDGVTMARRVRAENTAVQIVFITGYTDYIAEGYDVAALHYLVKPVREEKLFEVLDRAAAKLRSDSRALTLECGGEIFRVPLYEIRYLDVEKNYTTVHAKRDYTVKKTLGALFVHPPRDENGRDLIRRRGRPAPARRLRSAQPRHYRVSLRGESMSLFSRRVDKQLEAYQRELVDTHYKEVENMYRQIRGWRHDYRNHIQVLKAFAAKGDMGAYLDELDTDLNTVDTVVKTGNAMADAILNSKISLAKSRGITVQADAHIPVKLKMSELDLCCILGNLFDNAIEASMALPEKDRLIRVYMDMKGTQLYISFTNFTAGKKLEKTGGRFRTTKGEGHGFGLVRIDDIVARLDGYLSRNSEDGAFTTEILLPQV